MTAHHWLIGRVCTALWQIDCAMRVEENLWTSRLICKADVFLAFWSRTRSQSTIIMLRSVIMWLEEPLLAEAGSAHLVAIVSLWSSSYMPWCICPFNKAKFCGSGNGSFAFLCQVYLSKTNFRLCQMTWFAGHDDIYVANTNWTICAVARDRNNRINRYTQVMPSKSFS